MRTTLNLPDDVVQEAKRRALEEGKTLTQLIVEGLRDRLRTAGPGATLPVSLAGGGLRAGVSWEKLVSTNQENEGYR
ncbi:MAG: hypothetical protein V3S41_04280 [Spirochaetia bacterium]